MIAHKSKFGFHPCDRDTFLKLKFLNKLAMEALRQAASWRRWERKAPHNRCIRPRIRNGSGQVVAYQSEIPLPEPAAPLVFFEWTAFRAYLDHQGVYHKAGFNRLVLTEKPFLRQVIEDYRSARHPIAKENAVIPLRLTQGAIDAFYAQCTA